MLVDKVLQAARTAIEQPIICDDCFEKATSTTQAAQGNVSPKKTPLSSSGMSKDKSVYTNENAV